MASEEDQRKAIFLLLSRWEKTPTEIATTLGCSRSTVYRVQQRGPFKKDVGERPRTSEISRSGSAVEGGDGKARGGVTREEWPGVQPGRNHDEEASEGGPGPVLQEKNKDGTQ
ncbi:Hypothetical protein FKW44_010721 [Caligus rogercresseyi]|uniref:Uncharacterized protein n=1 Tax=Caligus rogercresseyi TaxID=217165 RepID=A0A7T8K8C8_CALRO|nr:Hypothetical protein FKW44_010721 [Caligus rogercresseyi]